MNQHILVVEDEEKISSLLHDYLVQSGFKVSVLNNGLSVDEFVKKHSPDLILLDLMLPGKDGMEVCKDLRKHTETPVIMVTAKTEEIDRLLGLEIGADDYVSKPFSPREIVARVKAVLRRTAPEIKRDKTVIGEIALDDTNHTVAVSGHVLSLTPSEFGLLKAMMIVPEKVFSRDELLNKVQGYDFDGYERTIDTHIKNLRKKIAKHLPKKEVIASVYGIGYKFSYNG